MITVDAPISFLVGGGLVAAAAKSDGTLPQRDKLLARGILFQSTILTPIILFFMVRFPDWEWNYLFNARAFFFGDPDASLGYVVLTLVVAAINLSFVAGFLLVEKLLASGKRAQVNGLLAGTGALIGLIMAIMYRQTLYIGSYAEFQAGQGQLIFTHPVFVATQTIAGALITGSLFMILRGHRAATKPA